MAWEKVGPTLPGMVAGADLSSSQHRFVLVNSAGKVVVPGGVGAIVDGVLQNNPILDHAATVWVVGSVSKVEAAAAVTVGDSVTTDAVGKCQTAATGNYVAGRALTAATGAGTLVSVLQTSPGRIP